MDPELVVRAQRGDGEAFASLAVACGDRLHAVVAPDPARHRNLPRTRRSRRCSRSGENLPMLRDPARFEAWSCRLLVHACHDEAQRSRHWNPNFVCCTAEEHRLHLTTWAWSIDRDQLERGFRRLSIDHRAVVVLHHVHGPDAATRSPNRSASPPARSAPDSISRCARLRAALEADARSAAAGGCQMSTERDVTLRSSGRGWRTAPRGSRITSSTTVSSTDVPATPQRRRRVGRRGGSPT